MVKSSTLAKLASSESAADSHPGKRGDEGAHAIVFFHRNKSPTLKSVHQPLRTKQKWGRMKREEKETGR